VDHLWILKGFHLVVPCNHNYTMLSIVGRRAVQSLQRAAALAVHVSPHIALCVRAGTCLYNPLRVGFSTQSPAEIYQRAADILDDPLTAEDATSREKAVQMVVAAARSGVPAAVGRVGRWHLFGLCDHTRDVRKAVELLHQAAAANDVIAQFWLGNFYLNAHEHLPSEQQSPSSPPNHLHVSGAPETAEEESSRIARGETRYIV
jgi:TPR repeat protein